MSSLIRPVVVNTARHANLSLLSHGSDEIVPTTTLLRAAGICDSDHVVVIGRGTLDHLIALNRLNCRAVTVLHPDRALPGIDKADVIWVAGGVRADLKLLPKIQAAQGVRTVVIELAGIGAGNRLPVLLEELRFEGFVHVVCHGTADRRAVMASRPDWLRRVV